MESVDVGQDWKRVGQAIADRIDALSLSKAEVIRRSGVSDKTLAGYIDGQPIMRPDKRRQLAETLGWSTRSIDLILDGGEPEVEEADRLDEMDRKIDLIAQDVSEVRAAVNLLLERLGSALLDEGGSR